MVIFLRIDPRSWRVSMVLNVQSEIARDVQRKPIEVISTGATLGAEVRGVDLKNIDASQFTALERAWHDHQVILVRGQTLGDQDLIAFSRRFGDLDWAPVQETGRRMVYLGRRRNAYLMGLELADSEALLDELWDFVARPEFAWEHVWKVGDLVLWDNRCTMHRRDPFDDSARRIMHRTQIKGSAAPV